MSRLVDRCPKLGPNFIASLVLPNFPTTFHDMKEILVDGFDAENIENFLDADDTTFGMMDFKYGPEKFADYHSMISQLLLDPLRYGKFYVDGNSFKRLATMFTKYLLNHPAYVFPLYWPRSTTDS